MSDTAQQPTAQHLLNAILKEEKQQTEYLRKMQRTISMLGWLIIIGTAFAVILIAYSSLY